MAVRLSALGVVDHAAVAGGLVDGVGALHGGLPRLLVHELAVPTSWVSMTSISSTSSSRAGQAPVRRQTTQRTISASPCSITSAPASGITDLKW